MEIKLTISNNKNKPLYPCLGIFPDNVVVLFTSLRKGVCIYSDEIQDIGRYSDSWKASWRPLSKDEQIILSN